VRSSFFTVMAGIQLAIVLSGFAPTFYLRSYFAAPELPMYLLVHGIVLTAWFVLLLVQSWLGRTRQHGWHWFIGWIGAAVAVGVVVTSALAATGTLEHPRVQFPIEPPRPVGAELLEQRSVSFFNTLALLLIFAVLVTAAFFLRNKPTHHKRLVSIASAAMASAAAFRWPFLLAGLGVSPEAAIAIGGRAGMIVSTLLIAAIALYDKLTLRHVARATWWGAGVVATIYVLVLPMSTTRMGLAWVARIMHDAG
jgi:hypothetical protein